MGGVVGFFEALNGDVSVDLRRDEVRVAEEFLDAAEIGAAIEKMRGVAVAEFVRGEIGVESGPHPDQPVARLAQRGRPRGFQDEVALRTAATLRSELSNLKTDLDALVSRAPSLSDEELSHDYLWRCAKNAPERGRIGIFNRSHYEAVLAERILKIVSKETWSGRYKQIVDFEQMLVENKVVLLKFFLHISKKEQAERFNERLQIPHKRWKFSSGDLETRRRWDDYRVAYQDMLNKTSHAAAPWHIVPADRNWYRNYVITQTVVRAMEKLKMKCQRRAAPV